MLLCVGAGVDLSYIVKAVPTVSSNEKQGEQTHEVLQVRLTVYWPDYCKNTQILFCTMAVNFFKKWR